MRRILTSMLALSCLALVSADEAPSKDEKPVTLMGMLMEWHYPDADFGGGQMSDAGVTGVASIKCKSVLTTPDPADKVLAFYLKKLHVNKEGSNLDQKGTERVTTERSVLVQTVTEGDSPLHVIAINGRVEDKPMSTTLVISRAPGEGKTRIAWSCYRQVGP
jgi:hypothetical protein